MGWKEGAGLLGLGAAGGIILSSLFDGVDVSSATLDEVTRDPKTGAITLIDKGSYIFKPAGDIFVDAVPKPHFDIDGVEEKAKFELLIAGCPVDRTVQAKIQGVDLVSNRIPLDASGASRVRECMDRLAGPAAVPQTPGGVG